MSPVTTRRTLLGAAAAVGVVAVVWWVRSHQFELVTSESLAAARSQWRAANWRDYNLELEVRGQQPGRYSIQVRDAKLRRIEQNGRKLAPAAGQFWTVDGLFELIEVELRSAERPPAERPFPIDSQVWLRMLRHPSLGYPIRYVREVTNANMGVEIRVLRLIQTGN